MLDTAKTRQEIGTPNSLYLDEQLEFDVRTLRDETAVLDTLYRHGVALVRGVVEQSVTLELQSSVDSWYDNNAGDFELANGVAGAALRQPVDSLLNALSSSIFPSVARRFLSSDRIVVPVNHFLWRRRNDVVDALREKEGVRHFFHQDFGLIPEFFPLNAWMPLSPVDKECNGLSFILPCPTSALPILNDPLEYIDAIKGRVWTPDMAPGDLLIFHRLTLHGSWMVRGKKNARYSAEFRTGAFEQTPETLHNTLWHFIRPS